MTHTIKTKVLALLLICTSVFSYFTLSVSAADDGIMPLHYNIDIVEMTASVSSSGLLSIDYHYLGTEGITAKVKITTYLEKKILGLFWSRVDIGKVDDEWVDIIYDLEYDFTRTYQLSSTGTYRGNVTFIVTNSSYENEEIVKTSEVKYQ